MIVASGIAGFRTQKISSGSSPAGLGLSSVSKKRQNIGSTSNTLTAAEDRPFFSPFVGCPVNFSDSTCSEQHEPVMGNSSTLVC